MHPAAPRQSWHFLDTGSHSGRFNMETDLSLAHRVQRSEILPTVRLYGWKPWAVSLGYHQSEHDILREKCAESGIDIVRRPTGGRAILHANELTYSVTMLADHTGITETYSRISKALVTGLRTIFPGISYEISQPNFSALYKKQESIPCFSASARYEVQIEGKKLVGSAQRRWNAPGLPEVVLQHGSILLGKEHALLSALVRVGEDDVRKKILHDIETKTIDLSTAAGRTVSYAEAAEAVRRGFEESMSITFLQPSEVIV